MVPTLYDYQKQGVLWMQRREQRTNPCGGIVADEMGLGKTVQAAAVLRASWLKFQQSRLQSDSDTKDPKVASHATLVIAPQAVQDQWVDELRRFAPELKSSIVVYGKCGAATVQQLDRASVVLTTYGVLARELKRTIRQRILLSVSWHRIILDEAHTIKNVDTDVFKAAFNLVAAVRWCLTGTPMINGTNDLTSLCKFLRCTPQDKVEWWHKCSDTKSAAADSASNDLTEWRERVILRRTKMQVHKLPPLSLKRVTIPLTQSDAHLYQSLLSTAEAHLRQLKTIKANKHVLYTALFFWLLRLRQLSSDSSLFEFGQSMAVTPGEVDGSDESPVDQHVQDGKADSLVQDVDPRGDNIDSLLEDAKSVPAHLSDNVLSAKTQQAVTMIRSLLQDGKTTKILVYSQWTGYLDVLQSALNHIKVIFERYDGSMTKTERQRRLKRFQTLPAVKVLLISLRAGGLGLNLPQANVVLLMDQWFNGSVEEQAICRAHRTGQQHPVTVYRLIANTSIESCMLQLKARKKNTASVCVDGVAGLPYQVLDSVFTQLLQIRNDSDKAGQLKEEKSSSSARDGTFVQRKKRPYFKALSTEAKHYAQFATASLSTESNMRQTESSVVASESTSNNYKRIRLI